MLHKIRLLMEKNRFLRKLIPVIQETKLMQYGYYLHVLPDSVYDAKAIKDADRVKGEFRQCYEAHIADFEKVVGFLEDDFSRKTLRAVIEYRLSPCKRTLTPVVVGPQYFPRGIMKKVENMVIIDGGGVRWRHTCCTGGLLGKEYLGKNILLGT